MLQQLHRPSNPRCAPALPWSLLHPPAPPRAAWPLKRSRSSRSAAISTRAHHLCVPSRSVALGMNLTRRSARACCTGQLSRWPSPPSTCWRCLGHGRVWEPLLRRWRSRSRSIARAARVDAACGEGRAGWCEGRFCLVRVGWRAAVVPPAPRVPIQAPGWWATVDVVHVRQLNAGLLGKSSLLDITDSIVSAHSGVATRAKRCIAPVSTPEMANFAYFLRILLAFLSREKSG